MKDYKEEHRNKTIKIRSIADLVIGSLFVLIGIYLLIYDKVNLNVLHRVPMPMIDLVMGIVLLLYGSWRFRTGYKKDYYR